ncbi:NAD-dependent epimerase/dehydratase family protein [Dokdonia sp. R86516]|uniref:NAD-dependent epimerase/dehydratase family protein n=1 Tax=Dokdonia sp. R86516 TaxID=3093856 RepID=UPI0037CA9875
MITVLVTCVGSGVGQSAIDSLNLSRDYRILGCDGNPNVYAHSYCDVFEVVPSIYAKEYLDTIINLCDKHDVDLIIPGHDHELFVFATEIDRFNKAGVSVIVSKPDLIEISRDKKIWFDYWKPLGCNIVPTYFVKDFKEEPDTTIFPAIVKPSGGSASQGISIVNTLKDLEGLTDNDIIQPYLFPEKTDPNYEAIKKAVAQGDFIQRSEISIQLVFSSSSKFEGIFISKNTLKNGVPVFVDPINPETFEHLDEILKFVPICEEKGVRGPVNIQGRISENGLFFFEMNMRFTGITGNRALLGFNEVQYLVNDFLNLPKTAISSYAPGKKGVRQVACTTIAREKDDSSKKIITILGAGSNLGQNYLNGKDVDSDISYNLICRKTSLEKYTNLFKREDVTIYDTSDVNVDQVLCQSDTLINFISALAPEPDAHKYDAILFLQELSHKIAKAKIPFILNISSQSVYDQFSVIDKTEEIEVVTNSLYAFQKVLIEKIFADFNKFSPISNVVSLRIARIMNPNNISSCGFFGGMIKRYIAGEKIILDTPDNRTNLVHIDEVVTAIDFLQELSYTQVLPEILNFGGENITMASYSKLIESEVKGSGSFDLLKQDKNVVSATIDDSKITQLGYSKNLKLSDIIKEIASKF